MDQGNGIVIMAGKITILPVPFSGEARHCYSQKSDSQVGFLKIPESFLTK